MDIEVVSRHEKLRESSPEIARESISTNDYDRSPMQHILQITQIDKLCATKSLKLQGERHAVSCLP